MKGQKTEKNENKEKCEKVHVYKNILTELEYM